MNAKTKTIFYIVGFAVLLGIAYFVYNAMSANVEGNGLLPTPVPVSQPTPASTATESTQPAQGADNQAGQDEATEEETQTIAAIDFAMTNSKGEKMMLSDLYGKPIVINFWTSWCTFCKQEMPEFEKLYQEMGDKVHFVMLDCVDGSRETQAKGEKFIADGGYTFPVYFDVDQNAVIAYGIRAYPTSIFIDKDGNIVTAAQSALDEELLRLGLSYITEQ